MTAISNNNIAQAIYLASKDQSSSEQHLFFSRVTQFLHRKHLLSKTSEILLALEKIINKEEGKLSVKVSSPEKLQEKTKENLAQTFKKRYSARAVVFDEKIDERLLGGMRFEIDDEVIDLSVRHRMNKLQEYLTRTA